MDTSSAIRAFDFPLQINPAEIEYLGVREAFTWGPQALWLLCGLIWIFYSLVRDIPSLAKNTVLFAAGATLLAALGVGYEMRRRNRQTFLYPLGGRIGLYRGNMYKYSFSPAKMLRVRLDCFGWIVVVCKLLLPMLLLMIIVGVVISDGMKQSGPHPWQDMTLVHLRHVFRAFWLCGLLPLARQTCLFLDTQRQRQDRPALVPASQRNCTKSRTVMAGRYDELAFPALRIEHLPGEKTVPIETILCAAVHNPH